MDESPEDFVAAFEQRIGRKLKDRERRVLAELYAKSSGPDELPRATPPKNTKNYSLIVTRTKTDWIQVELSESSVERAKKKALEMAPNQDFSKRAQVTTYDISKFWETNERYQS